MSNHEGRLPLAHLTPDGRQQSLRDHLIGVASLCSAFASKLDLGAAGELIGLLHDLGKHSPEFQQYIRSASGFLEQDIDDPSPESAARNSLRFYFLGGNSQGRIEHVGVKEAYDPQGPLVV